MNHKRYGFTIVELLVVIVIVAILASITVVAFNGALTRSKNTARFSEVSQVMKLFDLYRAAHGDYPGFPVSSNLCIGTGFPEQRCGNRADDGGYLETNTAATDKLKLMGTVPSTHTPVDRATGPYITTWDDGWGFTIRMFMQGEDASECPPQLPNAWWIDGASDKLMCAKNFSYTKRYGA